MSKVSLADVKAAYDEASGVSKKKRPKRAFFRTHTVSSKDGLSVHLGIRIRNPTNNGNMHWGEKKTHKEKFAKAVADVDVPLAIRHITFVRWSPGTLDTDDNLNIAFKWIRDAACEWLGLPNDGPNCGVSFSYEQHKTMKTGDKPAEYGVTVRFSTELPADHPAAIIARVRALPDFWRTLDVSGTAHLGDEGRWRLDRCADDLEAALRGVR